MATQGALTVGAGLAAASAISFVGPAAMPFVLAGLAAFGIYDIVVNGGELIEKLVNYATDYLIASYQGDLSNQEDFS